jgi:predicted nucleotidyltransferase
MKFGLQQRDIDYISQALKKYPEISEAVIFGSRAMGNHKKGSDIDIAVKGEAVSHHVISSLTNMLQEELPIPFFFDIIHYETITSGNLLDHINRVGITIYPTHE